MEMAISDKPEWIINQLVDIHNQTTYKTIVTSEQYFNLTHFYFHYDNCYTTTSRNNKKQEHEQVNIE